MLEILETGFKKKNHEKLKQGFYFRKLVCRESNALQSPEHIKDRTEVHSSSR